LAFPDWFSCHNPFDLREVTSASPPPLVFFFFSRSIFFCRAGVQVSLSADVCMFLFRAVSFCPAIAFHPFVALGIGLLVLGVGENFFQKHLPLISFLYLLRRSPSLLPGVTYHSTHHRFFSVFSMPCAIFPFFVFKFADLRPPDSVTRFVPRFLPDASFFLPILVVVNTPFVDTDL